ncbi:MAG: allophanate hydrolase subunit 1 [Ramlibacter sp.]|nr:allophanate hydrolase subunit 1 [Ramlibacter sp.]
MANAWPKFSPVADHAVLVSFAAAITDEAGAEVLALDAALVSDPPMGLKECVPAYVNLLIEFDPLVTDHAAIEAAVRDLLRKESMRPAHVRGTARTHEVEVCYDAEFAPDLDAVARATGLSMEQAIEWHLRGDYQVRMYGFAPGYAYLAGVPGAIQVPRKPAAVRGIPAGSVLIAGAQCLVTTLDMPTGWSIIGRSPTRILTGDENAPFLFGVGDGVRFKRIDAARYRARTAKTGHE